MCLQLYLEFLARKEKGMNKAQKRLIQKLNEDNSYLCQGHESMIQYSRGMILIGILTVIVLVTLFLK